MKKTTLNLPKDLHRRLKLRSVELDRDMSEIVVEAIEQYLSKGGKSSRGQK